MSAPRQPQPVHRLRRRRSAPGSKSSPPETPITTRSIPVARSRCDQPGDLDVVGLVAVLLERLRIGRHEREALERPLQPQIGARRLQAERHRGGTRDRAGVQPPVVVETAHPQPFLAQQVEVDIGDRVLLARPGSARVSPRIAPFSKIEAWPSHARSVVDSPGPRRRVQVGGETAGGLRLRTAAAAGPPCRW